MNIVLNNRELCDLELLLNGGFNPLQGFLTEKDYLSVLVSWIHIRRIIPKK